MNSAERFRRIDELFRAALRLEPAQRPGFLDTECAEEPEIRAEVEELLSADHAPTGDLDQPALGQEFRLSKIVPPGEKRPRIPERIDRYRVVSKIGEGGMGVVYEAEQDSPRRTVALKVINAGVASAAVLRRFEHEAQVLGKLQHPGIAQVYEAGTFDAGHGPQPFFAMELIRGQPLTRFATVNDLATAERLDLLARIADAVQHAHQRGVIHRDLKPSNILVDESGEPKILDFGVARATDSDIQTTTLRTDVGQLVGTIPYMSPEQAAGDPDELDTRSDVYALGVVAYELLAGRLPYDVRKKVIHEAVRMIREETPPSLSSLNPVLRGDVETIVGKAMEKDKTRRYQSASALAADIRRYLGDEPIAARPPSAWYQFRKFATRNKAVVGAAAVVFVVLLAGVIVTSVFAVREARARDLAETRQVEAERQAAIAEAVNAFLLEDLLAAADPTQTRDRQLTVREVLDEAASSIGDRFGEQPLVEAAIRSTVGNAYMQLTEYEEAIPHLERALELQREEGGHETDLLGAMNDISMIYMDTARFAEAEAVLVEATELASRLKPPDAALRVDTMNNLASVYYKQRRMDEALALFEQAAILARRDLPDHPSTLSTLASLALVYQRTGQPEKAEPISLEAVGAFKRVHGPEHPYTLTALNNLALLYADQERFDEAEALFLEILEIRRRTLGDDHTDTLITQSTLARAYRQAGRFADGERLAIDGCEGLLAKLGPDHPYTRIALDIVIALYEEWGRPEEAAAWRARLPSEDDQTPP